MLTTLSTIRTCSFSWLQGLSVVAAIFLLVCFICSGTGNCQESVQASESSSNNKEIEALILLLEQKGLLSEEEVQDFLKRTSEGQQTPESSLTASQPSNVQDMEALNQKIEETQNKVDRNLDSLLQRDRFNEKRMDDLEAKVYDDLTVKQAKSSWAQRIKLDGDIRLRYQSDMFDENNADLIDIEDRSSYINTTVDRTRYLYRARLGVKAKLFDYREANVGNVEAGLRVATGNEDNPISTNSIMGDYYNKDSFVLDRAYIKYSWSPVDEKWCGIPGLSLIGGRMPNPFFSTDLIWDDDLNFEGFALNFNSDTVESKPLRFFLTAGFFPLEEVKLRQKDKYLFGGQAGFEHRPAWWLKYKLAVAYYQYKNIQGVPLEQETDMETVEDWDWSVPAVRQRGNSWVLINPFYSVDDEDLKSGLASDFDEINITAKIDFDAFYPVVCSLWADYVENIGYDKDEVEALSEISVVPEIALEEQTIGYKLGISVGYPQVRSWKDWNFSVYYKYLEADAVLDAFTDSDFHGGGTDAEGYILRLMFGLYENVWLDGRYITSNEIYQDKENPEYTQFALDTFQLSINAKF